MKEDDVKWTDINKSKNLLLSQTDWTQLPDTGLSANSVLEWRKWRDEVRKINQDNYDERIPAVLALKKLKDNHPKNVYTGEKHYFQKNGPVISRIDLKKEIQEILEEMDLEEFKASQVACEGLSLDDIDDIKIAIKHAQIELDNLYKEKIGQISPPTELNYLYMEKMNECIDYLSETGTSFPLLELLSNNQNKDMNIAAKEFLQQHSKMIGEFVKIEDYYDECLHNINNSDTIDDLKKIIEQFKNGH